MTGAYFAGDSLRLLNTLKAANLAKAHSKRSQLGCGYTSANSRAEPIVATVTRMTTACYASRLPDRKARCGMGDKDIALAVVLPFTKRPQQVRKQPDPNDAIGPRNAERDGADIGIATLDAIRRRESTTSIAVDNALKRIGDVERLDFRVAARAGFSGVVAYVLARGIEATKNDPPLADETHADRDSGDVL